MGWTFFFMFVVLKIPIVYAFWLVWYATREPPVQQGPRDDEGSDRHDHPHRRRPRDPRGPRRGGPHGAPIPREPRRVRTLVGRTLVGRSGYVSRR